VPTRTALFFVQAAEGRLFCFAKEGKMSRTLKKRVAKLEARIATDDRIPIYVKYLGDHQDIAADVQKRIDELIALRVLSEADRPRCVWWLHYMPYAKWMLGGDQKQQLDRQAALGYPEWMKKKGDEGEHENNS